MSFHSFQSRLLVFFLGLFALVQAATFFATSTANIRSATRQIEDQLVASGNVFQRLVEERTLQFVQGAQLLSGDFAFKDAYSDGDRPTVESAVENHRNRIGADIMVLTSAESNYPVVVDTLHPACQDSPFSFPDLVGCAEATGEAASSLVVLDAQLFRMAIVPLLAPMPVAWIGLGFRIDDEWARELKAVTSVHVSFLQARENDTWCVLASTLPEHLRKELLNAIPKGELHGIQTFTCKMEGDRYVTLVQPAGEDGHLGVILQQSLDAALEPNRYLTYVLSALALGGLLLSALGGILIARGVTRPVRTLAEATQRIEKGDYSSQVNINQQDELGMLARAFNRMMAGLADRDRVRDLLGKVVSPVIAEELLRRKEVVLGGEEREVTILFSDIRDFTSLSEGRSPQQVLDILNVYLTQMSAVIEARGGVVDKYVGDAIMAIFGAPLSNPDDADRAILAALSMCQEVDALNAEFAQRQWPIIRIGIGINTDTVVAGNMGAPNRLNYTVIGDGVNLASRLESLTKEKAYQTRLIVSEATLRKARGRYITRFLGEVTVKGKKETTPIHAVLGREGQPTPLPGTAPGG